MASTSTTADSASVTHSGGVSGRLEISQTVTLGGNDTFYTTEVTITNVSGWTMTDVRYVRNNDPDSETDIGFGPTTINDVLLNPNPPSIAAVNAHGDDFGHNTLMLADQTAINNDNGFSAGTVEVRASAFGFENLDPCNNNAFDNPADPNGASGDIGINLVFQVDTLDANETFTISWITSINAVGDGNDVLAALQGQTSLAGEADDDSIYASQETTSETLDGGTGDDTLIAHSTGTSSSAAAGPTPSSAVTASTALPAAAAAISLSSTTTVRSMPWPATRRSAPRSVRHSIRSPISTAAPTRCSFCHRYSAGSRPER